MRKLPKDPCFNCGNPFEGGFRGIDLTTYMWPCLHCGDIYWEPNRRHNMFHLYTDLELLGSYDRKFIRCLYTLSTLDDAEWRENFKPMILNGLEELTKWD